MHSVWVAFFAVLHIHTWWYSWDLRSQPPDTSPVFIAALLGPALIYLSTYVLLDGGFPANAQEHFARVRRPFFALVIAGTTQQFFNPWIQGYSIPLSFRTGAVFMFGAAVTGFFTKSQRVHGLFGVFFLLSMVWAFYVRFEAGERGCSGPPNAAIQARLVASWND